MQGLLSETLEHRGDGGPWVTRFPESGSASRDNPGRIMVQPMLGSLGAGTHRGGLTVLTANDGELHPVNLLLLVLPPGTTIQASGAALEQAALEAAWFAASDSAGPVAADSACTPSRLLVQFTSLFANFHAVVGWPTTVRVLVRDDCGNAAVGGTVVLTVVSGRSARWRKSSSLLMTTD